MSQFQIGVLISFGITFAILSCLAYQYPYFPVDQRISLWMQAFEGHLFPMMHFVSFISSRLPATIIVVSVAIWLGRSGRRIEAILTSSVTVISSLAIVPAIKSLVDRPRPTPDLVQVMTLSQGESFPSGHATFAVVFYGFLFYLLPSLTSNRTAVKTLRILLATLIGLTTASRIYLGAHWFSDVIGGLVLGGLVLLGSIIIYCHYWPRFLRREGNAGTSGSRNHKE